jgi:hypothetical protein
MLSMVTQNLRRMLAPMLPTLPNFHRDDALDLCQRCDIAERHKTANDCINGLRDALSRFDERFHGETTDAEEGETEARRPVNFDSSVHRGKTCFKIACLR